MINNSAGEVLYQRIPGAIYKSPLCWPGKDKEISFWDYVINKNTERLAKEILAEQDRIIIETLLDKANSYSIIEG